MFTYILILLAKLRNDALQVYFVRATVITSFFFTGYVHNLKEDLDRLELQIL